MATIQTYTKAGTKATSSAKLDKAIFNLEVKNHDLLKQAYLAYMANGREQSARSMTRGEIRGGGKKPWRQKGTGRARFGSSRNPIWRGGGIVFGPTGEENHTHNMSTQMKRLALRHALSVAASENRIKVIDNFECKSGKVQDAVKLLAKIEASGKILLAVTEKDLLTERATRNISDLKVVSVKYLNVYDMLNADTIVLSQKSVEIIHDWLAPSTKNASVKENKS